MYVYIVNVLNHFLFRLRKSISWFIFVSSNKEKLKSFLLNVHLLLATMYVGKLSAQIYRMLLVCETLCR